MMQTLGFEQSFLLAIRVSTAGWGDLSRGVHVRNDGPLFELAKLQ